TPPPGGATYTGTDLGTGPLLMQLQAAVAPGVVTTFDELRLGRTYAEVAPVPEPLGAVPAAALLLLAAPRRRACATVRGRQGDKVKDADPALVTRSPPHPHHAEMTR